MNQRNKYGVFAAFALAAALLPFTISAAFAQGGAAAGPRPGQGQGLMPTDQRMPIYGGGGPSSMVSDGGHLFIVQGNKVFKVTKSDLKVVAQNDLLPPIYVPGNRGGQPGFGVPTKGGGNTGLTGTTGGGE